MDMASLPSPTVPSAVPQWLVTQNQPKPKFWLHIMAGQLWFRVHCDHWTYETQIGFNLMFHVLCFTQGCKEADAAGPTSSSPQEAQQPCVPEHLLSLLWQNIYCSPRRASECVGSLGTWMPGELLPPVSYTTLVMQTPGWCSCSWLPQPTVIHTGAGAHNIASVS